MDHKLENHEECKNNEKTLGKGIKRGKDGKLSVDGTDKKKFTLSEKMKSDLMKKCKLSESSADEFLEPVN